MFAAADQKSAVNKRVLRVPEFYADVCSQTTTNDTVTGGI